jgi:hypothetical protein
MQRPRGRRGAARGALQALAALACAFGSPAAAEEGQAREAPPAPSEAPPPVGLERLLKLPSTMDYSVERRAGLTRGEWRARFERIDAALASEKQALETAQAELDRVAGSADQWLVGPPGMTNTDAPLDYRLRQEITRRKDEIERLETARKDLEVEANLAGVPEDWRP